MRDEIHLRADELTYDFGAGAVDEGICRVEDSVLARHWHEGQRWLSAIFELVRRNR